MSSADERGTDRPGLPVTWARRGVQAVMVGALAYVGIRHQLVGGAGGAGPIDSFCPFGLVESLPSLLAGQGFLAKTGTTNIAIFGTLAVITIALGAAFCGWLCPFGAIQDWLASVGRMVFGRQYRIPERVHGQLRHVRWLMLAMILGMTAGSGTLWFAQYDPFRAFFHFKFESWIAYALVGVTVVGALAVERSWCLYLCPLGALVGLAGRFGLTKVHRDRDTCIDCGACSRVCPSRIDVARVTMVGDDLCTMCTECVAVCPAPGALALKTGSERGSLAPIGVGLAALALFFSLTSVARAVGLWQPGSGGCASCTAASTNGGACSSDAGSAVSRIAVSAAPLAPEAAGPRP